MEVLINKLLAGNSIQEDTKTFLSELERPESILELCELTLNSEKPAAVRLYCANTLRGHFSQEQTVPNISEDVQKTLKDGLLNAIYVEKANLVRKALVRLASVILKLNDNNWGAEVVENIFNRLVSKNSSEIEIAASFFMTLTEETGTLFEPYLENVLVMNAAALEAVNTSGHLKSNVTLYIIQGVANLSDLMEEAELKKTFESTLPTLLNMLKVYSEPQMHAEQFEMVFDIIETYAESEPMVLNAHVTELVEFSLKIALGSEYEDSKRIRALYHLSWLVQENDPPISVDLLKRIIQSIFQLMMLPSQNPAIDEYLDEHDSNTPMTCAIDTMDLISGQISGESFPVLLELMQSAFNSNAVWPRRTAYIALAVVTKDCACDIKANHFEEMFRLIVVGCSDNSIIVRNSAFFALEQFAETFQKDINVYSKEIFDLLFQSIKDQSKNMSMGDGGEPKHIHFTFETLDLLVDALPHETLRSYLPTLIEHLCECLRPQLPKNLTSMALQSLSIISHAADIDMSPYFNDLVSLIRQYLIIDAPSDVVELRTCALSLLFSLALAVGKEQFKPLAENTLHFVYSLLQCELDDEELVPVYCLFNFMAEYYCELVNPILPTVIQSILDTGLKCDDELLVDFMDTESDNYCDDDDEEDEVCNERLEEAIRALASFAKHCSSTFLPFWPTSFQKVFELIENPAADVRKACVEVSYDFLNVYAEYENTQEAENCLTIFFSKLEDMLCKETNVGVAIHILECMKKLIKRFRQRIRPNDHLMTLTTLIEYGVKYELRCQVENYDKTESITDIQEVHLLQSICDLLPAIGKAVTNEVFAMCFNKVFPIMESQMVEDCARDIVYHTLNLCLDSLGSHAANHFDTLFPKLLALVQDEAIHVRQHAVSCLSKLMLQSGERSYEAYPQVLEVLSHLMQDNYPGMVDRICGALARLILNNPSLVSLSDVLPLMLSRTPLQVHVKENLTVLACMKHLYSNHQQVFEQFYKELVSCTINLLFQYRANSNEQKITAMAREVLELCKTNERFPQVIGSITNTEVIDFLRTI